MEDQDVQEGPQNIDIVDQQNFIRTNKNTIETDDNTEQKQDTKNSTSVNQNIYQYLSKRNIQKKSIETQKQFALNLKNYLPIKNLSRQRNDLRTAPKIFSRQ